MVVFFDRVEARLEDVPIRDVFAESASGVSPVRSAPIPLRLPSTNDPLEVRSWSEMQDHPHLQVAGAKIVTRLSLDSVRKLGGRLAFDDDLVVHDHVEPVLVHGLALVVHRERVLPAHLVAPRFQFHLHRDGVCAFEKPESECVVNLVERANYRLRGSASRRSVGMTPIVRPCVTPASHLESETSRSASSRGIRVLVFKNA